MSERQRWMSKKVCLAGFFCLLAGLAFFFAWRQPSSGPTPGTVDAKAAAKPSAALSSTEKDGKDLSRLFIEGMQLFNGDQGKELWRLKASWGNIVRNGEEIELESPDVRYTLGDPELEDYLYVQARKGKITDKQQVVEMWGDVVVRHGEETVTGPLLTYDSRTREMRFPKGAVIDGPTADLHTPFLRWKMDDNLMQAEQGVDATLKARPLSGDVSGKPDELPAR